MTKQVQQRDRVIIRFAGDSGDGMQLAGDRFTQETASFGNDLSTLPNFPAEIRAPAGTLPGVSSFQLHFADHDILTPGDAPDVLVAMNPAALKANFDDVPRGADIIANTDEFTKRNLAKVGYAENPLEDGSLSAYQLHALPITSMTVKALVGCEVSRKDAERAKNMFALGLLSWLYSRPVEGTMKFLTSKFATKPEILKANIAAFQAGWNFGETTEAFSVQYEVKPATLAPGLYRNITGNSALTLGLVAASRRSGLPLFLGSYPITPASDILHELSKLKRFGVRTFQAEDEIAAVGAAPGSVRRAAADHLRHPARGAVNRHADKDRAGGPADGALRQERRVASRDTRACYPGRLLRHSDRGGADRGQVPDPGDHPVRRLPGERLGAVADPDRGQPGQAPG